MRTIAGALVSFALLAAMFVPLERLFPARKQPILRPRLRTDAAYFFGQYLVWSTLAVVVLTWVRLALDGAALARLHDALAAQPTVLRALEVVIAGDLLVYAWHRACHASPLLWRFHAVHHTAEHLDWLAAHREHPLDGLTTQLAQNLPAFVAGFPLGAIAALAAFRGAWGIFIHSNTRLPLGPLRLLFGAPELHHFHHRKLRAGERTENFANLAPWIDWIFGTYSFPVGEETYPLGLDEEWPNDYVGQLVQPFRSSRASASAAASATSASESRASAARIARAP